MRPARWQSGEHRGAWWREGGLDRVRPGLAVRLSRPVGYIEAIRREELDGAFRGATEAYLFLHVWTHRRELIPDRGCRRLEHAAQEAVRDRRGRRRFALAKR